MQSNAITAYEGPENYIFISYAHKDTEKVLPILETLCSRGYRIWYDDGITPGSEWPEDIAQHLNGCAMAIAFVSPNSMASVNCRREINFALSRQKPFLSVVLEPTEMPLGMELQLSAQQSVLRYNYRTEAQFIEKICACPDLACCRAEQKTVTEPAAAPADTGKESFFSVTVPVAAVKENALQPELPREPAARKERSVKTEASREEIPPTTRKMPVIAVAAVVLVIVAALAMFLFAKPKQADTVADGGAVASQPEQTQAEQKPTGEIIVHARVPQTWQNIGLWAVQESSGEKAFDSWPGESMVMDAQGWYTAKIPAWANCVTINGNKGQAESHRVMVEQDEVWIIVEDDRSCQVRYDGPFTGKVTVYAQVPEDWPNPRCWAWNEDKDAFDAWPGEAFAWDGTWYSIQVPSWITGVIINSGEYQTEDIPVEPGRDIWIVEQNGWWIGFYEEPTAKDIQEAFAG